MYGKNNELHFCGYVVNFEVLCYLRNNEVPKVTGLITVFWQLFLATWVPLQLFLMHLGVQ